MRKLLIILLCLLVLAAGCGKKSGQVNLVLISWYDERDAALARKHIDEFEKLHPDIKVDLEILPWGRMMDKLMITTAGGRPPDVSMVCSAWFAPLAAKGVLVPIDDYVKDTSFDIGDFYETALEDCRYDGKLYSIPISIDSYAMYYNKKIFDEAGVPYPKGDWDFNDLVAMGKKLSKDTNGDGRLDQWCTAVNSDPAFYVNYLYGFGGNYLSPDKKRCLMSSPEAVEACQFMVDMICKYKISPNADDAANMNADKLFTQGKLAMVARGSWAADSVYSREGKAVGLEFDVAPMPRGPRGRGSIFFTNSYAVLERSKHKKEAWLLTQWMAEPTLQQAAIHNTQGIPARKSLAKEFLAVDRPPRNKQAFIDAIDFGRSTPKVSCWPEVNSLINSALQKMLLGKEPVKQIADDLVPTVDKMLAGEGK